MKMSDKNEKKETVSVEPVPENMHDVPAKPVPPKASGLDGLAPSGRGIQKRAAAKIARII